MTTVFFEDFAAEAVDSFEPFVFESSFATGLGCADLVEAAFGEPVATAGSLVAFETVVGFGELGLTEVSDLTDREVVIFSDDGLPLAVGFEVAAEDTILGLAETFGNAPDLDGAAFVVFTDFDSGLSAPPVREADGFVATDDFGLAAVAFAVTLAAG